MKKIRIYISLLLLLACCMNLCPTLNVTAATQIDYSAIFDANYYYNTYSDLQQTIGNNPDALLKHFLTIGMKEGRNGNSSFQVKAYMLNNLDLLPVYGIKDLTPYYMHYLNCGQKEGRIAVYQHGQNPAPGVLASYSTKYDAKEVRTINLELAASRINGMVIKPGEKFSFSNSIGTRTLENGYVVAPSFAAGKVVESVGGGICQVSSNIYVTMLLAGITPTERYTHSLPVTYVPPGLDSAIVEGYKDLSFTNHFDYSIIIHATTKNGTLTVSLSAQP